MRNNWEPVQTPKRRSDVLSCSGASDEPGGCILIQLINVDSVHYWIDYLDDYWIADSID